MSNFTPNAPASRKVGEQQQVPMPTPAPFPKPKEEDTFEIDLSGVAEGGAVLIPDGQYEAICIEVKHGYAKSSGNPQWIWRFAIAKGPHAGVELPYYTALTPGALWKVSEVVTALGLGQPGQKVSFKKEQARNRRCLIEVVTDTYNNQKRSTITQILPHPEGPGSAMGHPAAVQQAIAIQQAAAASDDNDAVPF